MFSERVPAATLLELLEKCCEPPITTTSILLVNETSFKKMLFHKYHTAFLAVCVSCYSRCHRHYVTRPLTYSSWLTLVRQISQSHNWTCTSVREGGSAGLLISTISQQPIIIG
jgi:hypothetical protein